MARAEKQARDSKAKAKTPVVATETASPEAQRLRRVLDATSTENPKREDIDELRRLLKEYPELWRVAGDFASLATDAILKSATSQVVVRESAEYGLEVLKKEMGYDHAPVLEKLLIENVAICRLQFYDAQAKHARGTSGSSVSIASADYWERRLMHSHVRYLKACETLARVRKLSQPGAVQVNIAERQTNIAQGAPSKSALPQIAPGRETKEVNANSKNAAQSTGE